MHEVFRLRIFYIFFYIYKIFNVEFTVFKLPYIMGLKSERTRINCGYLVLLHTSHTQYAISVQITLYNGPEVRKNSNKLWLFGLVTHITHTIYHHGLSLSYHIIIIIISYHYHYHYHYHFLHFSI